MMNGDACENRCRHYFVRLFFSASSKIAIINFWLNSMSYKIYEKKTAVINYFFCLTLMCATS